MNLQASTDDDDLRRSLEAALGPLEREVVLWSLPAPDRDELAVRVETEPEVMMVGPQTPIDAALWVARTIDEHYPWVSVLIIAEHTTELLEQAIRAGAAGIVDPQSEPRAVRDLIDDAKARARRRRQQLGVATAATRNQVIPVLSAKGGVGKTMLSTNLAHALAAMYPGEVVIVDADMQFGDVTSNLGVEPAETISDTTRFGTDLDATTLKAFVSPVGSDLFVLSAPLSPALADDLTAAHFGHVLRLLHQEFRFVVVDTSAGIDEITLEALDVATKLVVLASMDVPSVRAVTKELDALRLLGMDHLEWFVVLNRANTKVGLSVADIEATIGRPISAQIPSTRAVPASVNQGTPLVISDPRTPIARAMSALAREVAGVKPESSSRFTRKGRK